MAMAMMSDEIMQARRARLQQLRLRQGREGYATPPEIANEIADLAGELAPLNETVSDHERYQSLFRGLMLLSSDVASLRRTVDRLTWLLPVLVVVFALVTRLLEVWR